MKIAFLAHTTKLGGAAISQRLCLSYILDLGWIQKEDCILYLPHGELGAYAELENRIPIRHMHMPFSLVFKGASTRLRTQGMAIGKELIAILSTLLFYNRELRKEKVTHIHLNSIVFWSLLPFLPKEITKIIHIREIPRKTMAAGLAVWVINRYADKIIAITKQCAEPFPTARVVENPVDMYRARVLRNVRPVIKEKWGLPRDSFVISILAPVGLQKGYDVLYDILRKLPKELPIVMLAVGTVDPDGIDILTRLRGDKRFWYLNEQTDTDEVYALSDIILRCEDYLPLGRTVFEGIYAGCMVVLPIAKGDSWTEVVDHIGQIQTYSARDPESCSRVIQGLYRQYPKGIYDNGFAPTSNVAISASTFLHAIKN